MKPKGWPDSIRINADNGVDTFYAQSPVGPGTPNTVMQWFDDLVGDNSILGTSQFPDVYNNPLMVNKGGYWTQEGGNYGIFGYVNGGKLALVLADGGDFAANEYYGRFRWNGHTFTGQELTWENDPVADVMTSDPKVWDVTHFDGFERARNYADGPGTIFPPAVSFESPIGGSLLPESVIQGRQSVYSGGKSIYGN